MTLGAALLPNPRALRADAALRPHLQALCDQMGLALERSLALHEEAAARERAQTQAVRNALLAAISHDYRTPLATIMSAASVAGRAGCPHGPRATHPPGACIVEESAR